MGHGSGTSEKTGRPQRDSKHENAPDAGGFSDISDDSRAGSPVSATPNSAEAHGLAQPIEPSGVVEGALAEALRGAVEAGQWTVVELLGRELEARRKARAEVVDLDTERRRRTR